MHASHPNWTREGRIGKRPILLHKASSTDYFVELNNFLEWCDLDVPDLHEVVGPTKNYYRLRRCTASALLLMLAHAGYENAQTLVREYNLRLEDDGNITPLPIKRAIRAGHKKWQKEDKERRVLRWEPIPDGKYMRACKLDVPRTQRKSPHPKGGGVYVLHSCRGGEVLYVGQTRQYRSRLTMGHSQYQWCQENHPDLHITYHSEPNKVERLFLEARFIAHLRPSLQFVFGPWTSPRPSKALQGE